MVQLLAPTPDVDLGIYSNISPGPTKHMKPAIAHALGGPPDSRISWLLAMIFINTYPTLPLSGITAFPTTTVFLAFCAGLDNSCECQEGQSSLWHVVWIGGACINAFFFGSLLSQRWGKLKSNDLDEEEQREWYIPLFHLSATIIPVSFSSLLSLHLKILPFFAKHSAIIYHLVPEICCAIWRVVGWRKFSSYLDRWGILAWGEDSGQQEKGVNTYSIWGWGRDK